MEKHFGNPMLSTESMWKKSEIWKATPIYWKFTLFPRKLQLHTFTAHERRRRVISFRTIEHTSQIVTLSDDLLPRKGNFELKFYCSFDPFVNSQRSVRSTAVIFSRTSKWNHENLDSREKERAAHGKHLRAESNSAVRSWDNKRCCAIHF